MTDDPDARELDDALDPEVDPREAARDRRRDRDHSAHARALMRTGLSKGFKQILDSQAHRAERAARRDDRSPEAQRPKGKPKDERRRA